MVPSGAAPQDHEAVLVTDGADDGDDAGLGDGQEVVRVATAPMASIATPRATIRAVLEAHGEGQAEASSRCSCDSVVRAPMAPTLRQVGQELRRDSVQHLAGDGHALGGQVHEQLAADPKALVDLEAVVDVRVVDQALPATVVRGFSRYERMTMRGRPRASP